MDIDFTSNSTNKFVGLPTSMPSSKDEVEFSVDGTAFMTSYGYRNSGSYLFLKNEKAKNGGKPKIAYVRNKTSLGNIKTIVIVTTDQISTDAKLLIQGSETADMANPVELYNGTPGKNATLDLTEALNGKSVSFIKITSTAPGKNAQISALNIIYQA